MIQIDKGIPVPAPKGGKPASPKAEGEFLTTCRALEPGDSFLWPGTQPNAAARVGIAQVRTGYRFTTRREDGQNRIWRTA